MRYLWLLAVVVVLHEEHISLDHRLFFTFLHFLIHLLKSIRLPLWHIVK